MSNGSSQHLHINWPWQTDNSEVLTAIAGVGSQLTAVKQQLTAIQQKERGMATQADIDALQQRLGAAVSAIQAEISSLQAANPALDLSGLTDAVSSVEGLEMPPASDAPPASTP